MCVCVCVCVCVFACVCVSVYEREREREREREGRDMMREGPFRIVGCLAFATNLELYLVREGKGGESFRGTCIIRRI